MNNPFGIPDDMMAAIISAAISQSIVPGTSGMKKPNPDTKKVSHQEGAKAAKEIYDSYIAAGFSEAQAFELLKVVLTTKRIF